MAWLKGRWALQGSQIFLTDMLCCLNAHSHDSWSTTTMHCQLLAVNRHHEGCAQQQQQQQYYEHAMGVVCASNILHVVHLTLKLTVSAHVVL